MEKHKEYWESSKDEIEDILKEHKNWLDSYGKEGRKADLHDADLREANFQDANLIRADLQEAKLQHADLLRADLIEANLQEANLQGANLQGAKLQGAKLQGAKFQDADLLRTDLLSADLQRANLRDADLQEANLKLADLQGAYLQGANLKGAYLQGANLKGANLQEANLQGANLQEANLQRADLKRANLQDADLQRANLLSADLQRADLQRANLKGAYFKYADIQGAKLKSAILDQKDLENITKNSPDVLPFEECVSNEQIGVAKNQQQISVVAPTPIHSYLLISLLRDIIRFYEGIRIMSSTQFIEKQELLALSELADEDYDFKTKDAMMLLSVQEGSANLTFGINTGIKELVELILESFGKRGRLNTDKKELENRNKSIDIIMKLQEAESKDDEVKKKRIEDKHKELEKWEDKMKDDSLPLEIREMAKQRWFECDKELEALKSDLKKADDRYKVIKSFATEKYTLLKMRAHEINVKLLHDDKQILPNIRNLSDESISESPGPLAD